jgi:hypothetical protein
MTSTTPHDTAEQLSLLPVPEVPLRFRLDEATRRRGLRHIAEIRARLEQPPRPAPSRSAHVDVERPAA